jgi:raffinose/stachyose/melibiose transport system substrate-binding protein
MILALLAIVPMLAVGCAPSPSTVAPVTQSLPGTVAPVATAAPASPTSAGEKVTLNVVLSSYWQEDWWKKLINKFEADHPNITINYWFGSDWTEYTQTQIAGGEVPDLFWLTRYEWIDDGLVMDLTDVLKTPAYGQTTGTWQDTFYAHPGPILYKGKYWTVPWDLYTDGYIWYNVDLFNQYGKQPPQTWNDLLNLCQFFKSKNINCFAQSNDPLYINQWWRMLSQRIAGMDKIRATVANQKGNAWTDPEFLQAATMAQDVANKGYFEAGYEGMNYQTAQIEFVQGHAAMMLIGDWLAGEMKDSWPTTFHADYVRFPTVDGGKGDPTVQIAGTSDIVLSNKTQHPKELIEFAKWMTSLEATTQMAADSGLLYGTKGSTPPDKLTSYDKKALDFLSSATDSFDWYAPPDFTISFETGDQMFNACVGLMLKQMTPEQFVQKLEVLRQADH